MSISFEAVYENGMLRPRQPLQLPEGATVQVTVFSPEPTEPTAARVSFGDWLQKLEDKHGLVEGPADWSENLDHYLYGDGGEQGSSGR